MLKEMTGEFPALSEVFVSERDIFLTNSLKNASLPIRSDEEPHGKHVLYILSIMIYHPVLLVFLYEVSFKIKSIKH